MSVKQQSSVGLKYSIKFLVNGMLIEKAQTWKVSWNYGYCTFPIVTFQQISAEFPSKLRMSAMTWIHLYQAAPSDGTMQMKP